MIVEGNLRWPQEAGIGPLKLYPGSLRAGLSVSKSTDLWDLLQVPASRPVHVCDGF